MPIKATFTGDVTDLRRSTQQARDEFKKVGTEAEGAARQLKAVGSSFDGSKLEGAARRVASGIERIGGVARLTDSEIAKNSRTISEVLQKYERMGVEAPANIRRLATELDNLKQKSASLKDIGPPDAAAKSFGLLQGAVAGVAAAFTSQGLSALKSFTADVIGMAGDISDLSAKTGLTTTQVQEFGYAAAQTGTSIDTVSTAVSQLSNKLVEGGTGTIAAVSSLGLELADLQRMDPGTAFTTIADAIAKVPDPMRQTQLAMELFGKAGAEILPAIKAGLSDTAAEASRLGLVISEESVQALDDLGDAWDRMALRVKAGAAQVIGGTATDFDKLSQAWQQFKGDGEAAVDGVTERITVLQAAMRGLTFVLQQWDKLNFGLETASGSSRGAAGLGADLEGLGTPTSSWRRYGRTNVRDMNAGIAATVAAGLVPDPDAERKQWEKIQAQLTKSESATKKLTDAQRELNAEAAKAFKFSRDAGQGWEEYAGSVELARMELEALIDSQRLANQGTIASTRAGSTTDLMMTGPYQYLISSNMTGGVLNGTRQIAAATKDWRIEVRGVAQAFAQLAQIAGPSLNGVTRGIGTAISSVDAAGQLIDSLAAAFPSLQTRDANGKLVMSGRGKALASVLASATTGAALGGMTTNPFLGGALGAGGGLATGAMLGASGATLGLSVAVGAASAIYTAQQNRRAQRAAMEQQRQSIISSMGGLDQFRESVERAGFSYEYFLSLFNSSDPDTFTDSVNRLNAALQEQDQYANRLSKGLQEVARVQGVLSQQQIAQIRNTRPGAPGSEDIVAFAQQQRQQAETGIAAAIAAIDTATASGTQNMEQFQSSIGAVTASLAVLFDTAIRNGDSAVTVLQRLADPIKQLQNLLTNAGQTPGAGFGALSVLTDIATGAQTGPLVSLAQGLGQALAGMANTGLLSPELFGELANGIGEAYHQLELLGKGGLEAARLMQPSLQAIWQMTQDNPALRETLDATTLALLDFAEQSGLIGEGFRPAVDRMIDALSDLIDKLNQFIDALNGIPPTVQMPTPVIPAPVGPGAPGQSQPTNPFPNGGDYTTGPTPLAAGGVVMRPTHALVGEAGPEAVIPLSRFGRAGAPIQITVVSQIDGYEAARAITRYQPDVYRTYGAA